MVEKVNSQMVEEASKAAIKGKIISIEVLRKRGKLKSIDRFHYFKS